jgi:N-acetylmuramoyl-L-alanine amidase
MPVSTPVTMTSTAPATNSTPVSAPTGSAPPPTVSPAPAAAPASEPVRIVTEARPTNSGTRSLIRSLGLKLSRVVIDAGHGGHDTGSLGPTGYTEKELVLDVSKRLKTLIENEMGAEVVMTRTEDKFVPLESRTQIANKESADLFVSIHANSSKIKSVRGVETFFLNFNTQSREALETATRENAASELGIHELQDIVNKIILNDKVDESRELAQYIQNAMAKRANAGSNRGVKQAPFVVLLGANMPSILAEVSFISNPDEEKKLKTAAYRQQIAESLYQGIKSYAETLSSTKTAGASTTKTP